MGVAEMGIAEITQCPPRRTGSSKIPGEVQKNRADIEDISETRLSERCDSTENPKTKSAKTPRRTQRTSKAKKLGNVMDSIRSHREEAGPARWEFDSDEAYDLALSDFNKNALRTTGMYRYRYTDAYRYLFQPTPPPSIAHVYVCVCVCVCVYTEELL